MTQHEPEEKYSWGGHSQPHPSPAPLPQASIPPSRTVGAAIPTSRTVGAPPTKRPRHDPPDIERAEKEEEVVYSGENGHDSKGLSPYPSDFLHREQEEDNIHEVCLLDFVELFCTSIDMVELYLLSIRSSVAEPHHYDADLDPSFQIKAQNLEKVLK